MKQHWIVHGLVQGVGFRYFVRSTAIGIGVKGWTRNLPDGTVEIVLEADQPRVDQLRDTLFQGNGHCRVEKIDEMESEEILSDEFKIRF